jgi:integrase
MNAADLPRTTEGDKPIEELTLLEPEEVQRLIDAARPGMYRELDRALYATAAFTGLRQGELRALRWAHVDFGQAVVHVLENVTRGRRSSPKGKRRRSVPLAPTAATALLALRAVSPWTRPDDPVFACASTGEPMARTRLMARYREALTAAGLARGFSFHDLRHTFGTTMARAGVPVATIQAWIGHADLQTTSIYLHYAPAAKDAAMIEAAFGLGTNSGTNLRLANGTDVTSHHDRAA